LVQWLFLSYKMQCCNAALRKIPFVLVIACAPNDPYFCCIERRQILMDQEIRSWSSFKTTHWERLVSFAR
jgi:hypothetical protein